MIEGICVAAAAALIIVGILKAIELTDRRSSGRPISRRAK